MSNKLYLLAGNGSHAAWWRDCLGKFRHFNAVPVELPGFGANQEKPVQDLDAYAYALLRQCQAQQVIVACGISSLIVLRASLIQPGYFRKIILYAPIGVFLWQRKLAKFLSSAMGSRIARFLLSYAPGVLSPLIQQKAWSRQQRREFSLGYRLCRSFSQLGQIISPANALQLLDTLNEDIHIIYGEKDRIADARHAAAWESVLARSRLSFSFVAHWTHYPYFEHAREFVDKIESALGSRAAFSDDIDNAHSKAGRFLLARRAGIKTPEFWLATRQNMNKCISALPHNRIFSWAVRSSSANEDQFEQSHAGQSKSHTAISSEAIEHYAQQQLVNDSTVIIQEYVCVKISGVAFVRNLSIDIEWVAQNEAPVTSGQSQPRRVYIELNRQHTIGHKTTHPFPLEQCMKFLRTVQACFHYAALDIEWGWNGRYFYLFQARPITTFAWRRVLTSANIDELLSPRPSLLMESTQRLASDSIPQIYALWDSKVLQDREPFTALFNDASYLNMDLYLAALRRWGVPSTRLARLIGACVPHTSTNPLAMLRHLPVFVRMLLRSRHEIRRFRHKLRDFERELAQLPCLARSQQLVFLQQWFLRLYVYIVQTNLCLNAAIVTALSNWRKLDIYTYSPGPHRVKFESDPASPRPIAFNSNAVSLPTTFASLAPSSRLDRLWDRFALPGNQSFYLAQRELFRECYTRLYYQLHFLMKKLDSNGMLFGEYYNARTMSGSFWQHSGRPLTPDRMNKKSRPMAPNLNYPGTVMGRVAEDILIVDRLDPGQFKEYCRFKAVIARGGGYLSHAAILLRESRIPSAFIPDLPDIQPGTPLAFHNGNIDYAPARASGDNT